MPMTALTSSVRPTRLDETGLLPEVERSAGEAFRDIPEFWPGWPMTR